MLHSTGETITVPGFTITSHPSAAGKYLEAVVTATYELEGLQWASVFIPSVKRYTRILNQ